MNQVGDKGIVALQTFLLPDDSLAKIVIIGVVLAMLCVLIGIALFAPQIM